MSGLPHASVSPADYFAFRTEMCCFDLPYTYGSTRFSRKGVAGEGLRPEVPPDVPVRIVTLMRALWSERPQDRPPFSIVLQALDTIKVALGVRPGQEAAGPHGREENHHR